MNNDSLAREYLRILEELDLSYLDPDHAKSKAAQGLSGLFLPSVRPEYQNAENKIMVIGRETRRWRVLDGSGFNGLPDYIAKSQKTHREFFDKELNRPNGDRGMTFHNFMRTVAQKSGGDGLIYSNLFCFSWKKKNPEISPFFEEIKSISERLLKAQIELLSPDVIIFANGMKSAKYRRDYFPITGDNKCCMNSRDYAYEGVTRRQLWEFDLCDRIRCLRIQHPSARSKEAQKARQFLIRLLPAA